MTPDEQDHFLKTAGSKEKWLFIYQYSLASLQTCMATNEIRSLRIGDVVIHQRIVNVRNAGAKNKFRIRTIPLETEEVIWAFEGLMWRAGELGAGGPHHFLFPYGGRGGHSYDPARPMSDTGLAKRWDDVRCAADLPWLRPYDLRHSAITRMAEKGVPIAVIMAFAGHMTLRMQQHYTQVSQMAMRRAVASTWSANVPKPSWLSVGAGIKRDNALTA